MSSRFCEFRNPPRSPIFLSREFLNWTANFNGDFLFSSVGEAAEADQACCSHLKHFFPQTWAKSSARTGKKMYSELEKNHHHYDTAHSPCALPPSPFFCCISVLFLSFLCSHITCSFPESPHFSFCLFSLIVACFFYIFFYLCFDIIFFSFFCICPFS